MTTSSGFPPCSRPALPADAGKAGIGGTGLGLYICRELVRRLDGRIWVEPGQVKGSTFCVQIPIAKQPAKRKRAKQAA